MPSNAICKEFFNAEPIIVISVFSLVELSENIERFIRLKPIIRNPNMSSLMLGKISNAFSLFRKIPISSPVLQRCKKRLLAVKVST